MCARTQFAGNITTQQQPMFSFFDMLSTCVLRIQLPVLYAAPINVCWQTFAKYILASLRVRVFVRTVLQLEHSSAQFFILIIIKLLQMRTQQTDTQFNYHLMSLIYIYTT